MIISGLDTCTTYEASIGIYCSPIDIAYLENFTFKTQCSDATEETYLNEYIIYPNPVSDELNISSYNSTQYYSFELIDIYGRIVHHNKMNKGKVALSLEKLNLSPGIYFLTINSGNNKYNYKVVKL